MLLSFVFFASFYRGLHAERDTF